MAQLLEELAGDTDDLVDGLHHVDGDADGAGLVGDGAGDGLANPPGGVGGELVALGVVELLHGLDQAQVALLDQVQEQHTAAHIALGDGHHQAEVGLSQLLLGLFTGLDLLFQLRQLVLRDGVSTLLLRLRQTLLRLAAGGHDGGQLHLLIGGEQRDLADLLEVHTHRVVDVEAVHQRVGVDQLFLLDLGDLLHCRFAVLDGQVSQKVLRAHLDAQRLQRVVDGVHLLALKIHRVQHLGQLAGVQPALFSALDEQLLQLLVFCHQRGGGQGRQRLLVQHPLAGLVLGCGSVLVLRVPSGGAVPGQQLIRHPLELLCGVLLFTHVRFPP